MDSLGTSLVLIEFLVNSLVKNIKNQLVIEDEDLKEYVKNIFYKNIVIEVEKYFFQDTEFQLRRWHKRIVDNIDEVRKPIISIIFKLVENNFDNMSFYTLSIPVLLAQLTGVYESIAGNASSDRGQAKNVINNYSENSGEKINELLDFAFLNEKARKLISYNNFVDIGNRIIYSDVFPDIKMALFRPTILHGSEDYLDYGTKINYIRTILMLDYVINLKTRINKFKSKKA